MVKQFLINLVIYFILISIVVGIVSYAMYGDASHGVPLLRIVVASHLAYDKPIFKIKN